MNESTTLCFSGHRTLPKGAQLTILQDHLRLAVERAINHGYETFLFGGCYGFDLLAAHIVLEWKRTHPTIKLCAIIPYEEQPNCWTDAQCSLYFETLGQCDDVVILQSQFDCNCYKKRNQYMVDHSRCVIAYWKGNLRSGTGQTIRMAQKAGLTVEQVEASFAIHR